MMKNASLSSVIVNGLETHLAGVRRIGPASWFCTSGSAPDALRVSLQGDWLIFEAQVDRPDLNEPGLELLAWNACLSPLVKWVRLPGGAAQLRAEVPLEPAERLWERMGSACTAIQEAAALSAGRSSFPPVPGPEADELDAALDSVLRETIRLRCEELGWRFHRRASGRTFIDLEVPGEFYQAQLGATPDGTGASLFVELVPAMEDLSPVSCSAVTTTLLLCGGEFLGARTVARGPEGSGAAGLESALSPHPDGRELESVFSCLSVACATCGREISALQETAVARQYLAVQGIDVAVMREMTRAAQD